MHTPSFGSPCSKKHLREEQAVRKFDKVQGAPLGSQGVTVSVADAVDVDSEGDGIDKDWA